MRESARGLKPGTYIRVRNACSRRHSRGRVIRIIGDHVYYRSDYNGSEYFAPLASVSVDRKFDKRMREAAEKYAIKD